MTNLLFDTFFNRHLGQATPFLWLANGQCISHDAFLVRASRFAHAVTGLGLVPGDRIALQVEKSADALAIYAATVLAGFVFLPLNPAYTAAELDYFIENSGAALVVCPPDRAAALAQLAARHGAQLQTLDTDGTGTLVDLAEGQPDGFRPAPRTSQDLAAILYTSGTTGRPKGAMLSQLNLLSNAKALFESWQFSKTDVLLHALPIFHTHGLFVATNVTLLAGGSMILLPRFDPDQMIAQFAQATTMMGVPTYYTRLLADPRLTSDKVAHMRLFISGSAPLLADTHRQWTERTGHKILERYGMTETNMNTTNPYIGDRRPGTVGLHLPGVELQICDAAGQPVAQGEIGTVEVRGANVFLGYWGMPDKTAQDLRPNGYFITGDLGQLDADGYLTIVGRAKDMIISGGLNIYPSEVEAVLDSLPGVQESAVIGLPHPDLGEASVAVIVPKSGLALDQALLRAGLNDRLARYKHPRQIILRTDLPRNAMGKVQKAALRTDLATLFK